MGRLQRLAEKAKQSPPFAASPAGPADFKATSNARNAAMIEEARHFAKYMKFLSKDLGGLAQRYDTSMHVLKTVFSAPMPRPFVLLEGAAVPLEPEMLSVGSGLDLSVLNASSLELKGKLQTVLYQLDQWLAAYREVKRENRTCEELRFELDAQRRRSSCASVALERQKTKAVAKVAAAAAAADANPEVAAAAAAPVVVTKAPSASLYRRTESAQYKLQAQEDKVARLTQLYVDKENRISNALLTLIRDTAVLRQYAAATMAAHKRAFSRAYEAFTTVAAAPPATKGTPTAGILMAAADKVGLADDASSGSSNAPTPPAAFIIGPGSPKTDSESGTETETGEDATRLHFPGTPELSAYPAGMVAAATPTTTISYGKVGLLADSRPIDMQAAA